MIPTLVGIMLINFTLTQFVPGGPIEQIIANMEGQGDVLAAVTGTGSETADAGTTDEKYLGARGLPPDVIAALEIEMGFARIVCEPGYEGEPSLKSDACAKEDIPALEQFLNMMWRYIRFDFGESYFRSIGVFELIAEKLPVSVTLGLWSTLIAYIVSIPLGIRKAVSDGSHFDIWTSAAIIIGYAIPGFMFAVLLVVLFAGGSFLDWFPLRGLVSDDWDSLSWPMRIVDYFWHIALPILALVISSFAGLTMLTKNSFMDEIGKQYVLTARAKGLSENRVLYGHVFRNAMLIVVAGFPSAFVGILFGSSLLIEVIFSLDGLGLLGFEAAINRDYPVMFGTLYFFTLLGLLMNLVGDLMYVVIDPRIDFDSRR